MYKRASVDYPGRFAQEEEEEEEEEDPNKILFCSKKSQKHLSPNFDISWCYYLVLFSQVIISQAFEFYSAIPYWRVSICPAILMVQQHINCVVVAVALLAYSTRFQAALN